MTKELRKQVVEGEHGNRRVLWIAIAIAIPFLCCVGFFVLAWFMGDAVLEALGLADLLQP